MQDRAEPAQDADEILAICSSEDLAHLGLIQSHGCLLALKDGGVYAASKNISSFLDRGQGEVLGRDASTVVLRNGETITAAVERVASAGGQHAISTLQREGRLPFELLCHQSDDATILEIVDSSGFDNADDTDLRENLDAIGEASNAFQAAAIAARAVKKLTGYDRTMIYRFLPDASGDVVAESREPHLTPYLGLRYPASDIPENARQLYLRSPIRIVADARSTPIAVETLDGGSINLGLARLRAVSKYHIEYLTNMRVAATLVTSIVVNGRLWGLVSCHHHSAKIISAQDQQKCIELTQALADRIRVLELENARKMDAAVEVRKKEFVEEAKVNGSLWYAALFGRSRFIRTMEVHGCAIRIADQVYSLGYCPPPGKIWNLINHAVSRTGSGAANNKDPVWTCTNLKSLIGDYEGPTAGAAYVQISAEPPVSLIVFKNELKREVYWGGNPDKAITVDDVTNRINPRKSFEVWAAQMTDVSDEWAYMETEFMRRLTHEFSDLSQEVFESLIDPVAEGNRKFEDIIFDPSTSDIRSIVDDFVPEGIATIAYRLDAPRDDVTGYANSSFYKFLGISRTETRDLPVDKLFAKLGLPSSVLDFKANRETTVEYVSPVSGQRMMKVRNVDLIRRFDRENLFEGLGVIYLHDETERQRIIEALDVSRRQHEVNTAFRSEILGGLSHELRTPLNAIIGYSEMLRIGLTSDPEKSRGYLDAVHDAGTQMLELIEQLLEVSRIEQGVLKLDAEPFDVRTEVEKSIGIVSEHALRHSQHIELAFEAKAVTLIGDARAFRQILINLLSNAVKFSPERSAIRVKVEKTSMDNLVIKVKDSGPGIAPQFRTSIFNPFSQVEGVESRSRPGAGIGLSIVKAYTELHGGTVTVDSEPQGGSVFIVRFPSWRLA